MSICAILLFTTRNVGICTHTRPLIKLTYVSFTHLRESHHLEGVGKLVLAWHESNASKHLISSCFVPHRKLQAIQTTGWPSHANAHHESAHANRRRPRHSASLLTHLFLNQYPFFDQHLRYMQDIAGRGVRLPSIAVGLMSSIQISCFVTGFPALTPCSIRLLSSPLMRTCPYTAVSFA